MKTKSKQTDKDIAYSNVERRGYIESPQDAPAGGSGTTFTTANTDTLNLSLTGTVLKGDVVVDPSNDNGLKSTHSGLFAENTNATLQALQVSDINTQGEVSVNVFALSTVPNPTCKVDMGSAGIAPVPLQPGPQANTYVGQIDIPSNGGFFWIEDASGNILAVDICFPHAYPHVQSVGDSGTIDLELQGDEIVGTVIVSPEGGNLLESKTTGLYVPELQTAGSATADVYINNNEIHVDAKVSGDTDNQLTINNGLFVPPSEDLYGSVTFKSTDRFGNVDVEVVAPYANCKFVGTDDSGNTFSDDCSPGINTFTHPLMVGATHYLRRGSTYIASAAYQAPTPSPVTYTVGDTVSIDMDLDANNTITGLVKVANNADVGVQNFLKTYNSGLGVDATIYQHMILLSGSGTSIQLKVLTRDGRPIQNWQQIENAISRDEGTVALTGLPFSDGSGSVCIVDTVDWQPYSGAEYISIKDIFSGVDYQLTSVGADTVFPI